MVKHNNKPAFNKKKRLRKSTVNKAKIQKSKKYRKERLVGLRVTRDPVLFCPGAKVNRHYRKWITPDAQSVRKQILAARTNALVEEYGELGAKNHLANKLKRVISDEDSGTFRKDRFVTFSGSNTVDIIYVDSQTNNVYVLEAKGGTAKLQKMKRTGKFTPSKGKKLSQGDWDYLIDVAKSMQASSSAAKQEAARQILNHKPGKLHYIGVSTGVGKSGVPFPKELFHYTC